MAVMVGLFRVRVWPVFPLLLFTSTFSNASFISFSCISFRGFDCFLCPGPCLPRNILDWGLGEGSLDLSDSEVVVLWWSACLLGTLGEADRRASTSDPSEVVKPARQSELTEPGNGS